MIVSIRNPFTIDGFKALAHMTQLETQLLGGTKITDGGMTRLKPFTELRKVSVFDTAVRDAGIAERAAITRFIGSSFELIVGIIFSHFFLLAEVE